MFGLLNASLLYVILNLCSSSGQKITKTGNHEASNIIVIEPKCVGIHQYVTDIGFSHYEVKNVNATQSSTFGSHGPHLAIDKYYGTFAVAVPDTNSNFAWWMGEFKDVEKIYYVGIVSSPDHSNAQYLKNFKIQISKYSYIEDPNFSKAHDCKFICEKSEIPVKVLFQYECFNNIDGKYVIIRSASGPISTAEVIAYSTNLI